MLVIRVNFTSKVSQFYLLIQTYCLAKYFFKLSLFNSLFTIVVSLLMLVILVIIIYFKQLLFYSFDPIGAEVKGLNTTFLNYLFLILLSIAIVGSLQTVGIILVLSMLIIPAAAAKNNNMYKETYSIWLQNSIHNEKVYELIKTISSITGLYLFFYFVSKFPSGKSIKNLK